MREETPDTAVETDGTAAAAPVKPRLDGEFRRLWFASGSSAIGDGVALAAAPLMASTLTDDPRLIAGVTMALTLPYAVLGLPAGVLVDRLDRRRSMAIIDLIRGAALGGFALLVFAGHSTLIGLYICFFLVGAFDTFFRNAAQAIVPAIVPRDLLVEANSRLTATETAAVQFIGPLCGAAMFVVAEGLPFGVDAASFLISAFLLTQLRVRTPPHPRPLNADGSRPALLSGLVPDMGTGVRWLLRHPLLLNLNIISGLFNIVLSGGTAILVVYANRVLGLGAFGYGVLLACEAAGAVAASRLSPTLVRRVGREWALVVVGLIQLVAFGVLWLTSWPALAGAMLMLSGYGYVTFNVVVVALRQTLIPDQLQGRVNSVYRLVAWGTMPIGAGLAGLIAYSLGSAAVYGLGAAVVVLITVRLVVGARRRWIATTLDAHDKEAS